MKKLTLKRIISLNLIAVMVLMTIGCGQPSVSNKNEFSGVRSICQLATLKCYYHNVARSEKQADNDFLKFFGNIGYKKVWIEYSGIVKIGIDASQVIVSKPDSNNVVKITMPTAKVLSCDVDENSIGTPLVDTGFLTDITADEKTNALGCAQKDMMETASSDSALIVRAQERAKKIIEGFVKNVGGEEGKEYSVEWQEIGDDSSMSVASSS
jgi:hypothetical protein